MPISAADQTRLLDEYESARSQYHDFAKALAGLMQNLLSHRKIQTHSVAFRGKDATSLAGKLRRPDKSYANLTDITDLAGVRITTYFADDVDLVAELLRSEFSLDQQASVDKRQFSDPNQFGYRSLHYVLSFGASRDALSEYRTFAGFKCEVQVRSILQHAWAEIEHDLGYKSAAGVPAILRRRFARIAGLLELADDEFSSIRSALAQYESEVTERIQENSESVQLDLPSFKALYTVPSPLTSLDEAVVQAGSGTLNASTLRRPDDLVARLASFGIKTIQQLETVAREERAFVSKFVPYWLENEPIGVVDAGIGAFYLLYVLAWRTQDRTRIFEYFNENSLGFPEQRDSNVDRVMRFQPSARANTA
jgi:putative GTP pyrophosphokinase